MRILIVHNTLNDSLSVSGVLKHYAWMANVWIEEGHPTDFVLASVGFPQLRQLAPRAGLVSSDGVFDATGYLSKRWRYFPAYAFRLATAHWLRLPARYDVVYASGQFIVEVYPALVLARRLSARLAVKVHHLLAFQPGRRSFFDRLFLSAEQWSVRLINRHADLLFCNVRSVAADYEAFERALGLTPKPKAIVGCGIDATAFGGQTEGPKVYDAVFLGRLHQLKGVFDLAKLWRHVVDHQPDARLVVIGEGPHRQQAERNFRQMGLADTVTFTGALAEGAKNQLLHQSRVGLSLSYEEGWGIAIAECLAAGLPVVAYQLPVFDEVFPGQLELVPLGDPQSAAERTLELLRDEPRRRQAGRRGQEFVRRYDYRTVAKAELAELSKLVRPASGDR
jgi:glycosyltransferase involved in cell wall biosynthesis